MQEKGAGYTSSSTYSNIGRSSNGTISTCSSPSKVIVTSLISLLFEVIEASLYFNLFPIHFQIIRSGYSFQKPLLLQKFFSDQSSSLPFHTNKFHPFTFTSSPSYLPAYIICTHQPSP